MTSPSDEATDDSFWRRPSEPSAPQPPATTTPPQAPTTATAPQAPTAGAGTPGSGTPGTSTTPEAETAADRVGPPTSDPVPPPTADPVRPPTAHPVGAQPGANPHVPWAPEPPVSGASVVPPGAGAYPGPPQSATPPPGWRPPVHVQPAAPRPLPGQDLPALEAAEASARTLTYGVGLVAGAVLLVVMCLLCSRILF